MKIHNLKIEAEYLYDLHNKVKTYEFRKNDRDFKVGDILKLTCNTLPVVSYFVITRIDYLNDLISIYEPKKKTPNKYVILSLRYDGSFFGKEFTLHHLIFMDKKVDDIERGILVKTYEYIKKIFESRCFDNVNDFVKEVLRDWPYNFLSIYFMEKSYYDEFERQWYSVEVQRDKREILTKLDKDAVCLEFLYEMWSR